MHIPDGLLPIEVSVAGYVTAGIATVYSLRKISQMEDPQAGIPKAALLSSAFLIASWIHIPTPPTSVHLVLNGFMGILLGFYAFPAILVGLFFQAVLFGHGGLTTLGVNATMMGYPALIGYFLFRLRHHYHLESRFWTGTFAFLGGALGLGIAALIAFVILISTIDVHVDVGKEQSAIILLTIAHIPLMFIEGAFTAMLALYLQRINPHLLEP